MYYREHGSNNKCKLIGMGRKQTLAPYLSHMVIIEVAALKDKKVNSSQELAKKLFPINIQESELRLVIFAC